MQFHKISCRLQRRIKRKLLFRRGKIQIDMFNQREKSNNQFALNIKDLGVSKNEKSYIAITHIDGNRMESG